jgi:glutamate/tyrosine decarboxylase-like PLP-dependent enzyme
MMAATDLSGEEMNHDGIRELLANAASRSADYLDGLESRSVSPVAGSVERLVTLLERPIPDSPVEASEILSFIDEYGSPATVASAGGRYYGFVTGGALPATLAAQYLAAAWDQNSFSHLSSPAIAAFEDAALRQVKQVLNLPSEAAGAFVTGATMANFTCLAAARNHVLKQVDWDVEAHGLFAAPPVTVVLGEEAHASLYKVLSLLGLGRDRVFRVPADSQGRMRVDKLPDINGPTIVCLQAGNVNSGAFDPAVEIIEWARDGGAWVHVDGAFGIWALVSPELASLAKDFTAADSWATDAHKWLNVPYDSGIAITRNQQALKAAMSISGAYLLATEHRDAIDYTPDTSRRARAIEVWTALNTLGRSGLADLVNRNCRQARDIAKGLRASGIEILNEVVLNQVVVSFGSDDRTRRVIAAIQDAGVCWCGGTVWQGRAAMRISLSSWATTDDDVARSVDSIIEAHLQS